MDMPLALLNRRRRGSVLNPAILFSVAGSRGFFYDFSDYTTQFTDTTGTTPVTGVGQSLALVNDKSGLGNHATQATAGSRALTQVRPMGVERRNLLTYSEAFDNAIWGKGGTATIAAGTYGQIFRCGATAASQLTSGSFSVSAGANVVQSVFARPEVSNFVILTHVDLTSGAFQRSWFNLLTGQVGSTASGGATVTSPVASISGPDANGRYRCTLAATFTNATTTRFALNISNSNSVFDGDALSGVYIWGAQLEVGSTATAYQRVITANEWYEEGYTSYRGIAFDGVDDFLQTAAIDFSNSDKMTVVAGVRKLSDAASGMIAELGNATTYQFQLYSNAAPNFVFVSRGSVAVAAVSSATFASPVNAVLSGLGDISGDASAIRANGAQVTNNADQGTLGNYVAAPIYIGRRAGTSFPFNGVLTFLCVINRTLTAAELAQLEAYANNRTGAYT